MDLPNGYRRIVSAGSHPATGRGFYGSRPDFLRRTQTDPNPTLARTSHDWPSANLAGDFRGPIWGVLDLLLAPIAEGKA